MGTFFDFFSDDDIEVRNFEYEVVGIYLTLDQTPSANDALIGGTFESITTTENGFFLRFKNPYKRDFSLYTFEHDKLVGLTFLRTQELIYLAETKKELMSKALFLFKGISVYYYCHCCYQCLKRHYSETSC